MWGKIMIPMYRMWLQGVYGLYGPRCPMSPERMLNLITHSLTYSPKSWRPSDIHCISKLDHYWIRWWLVVCADKCWGIINGAPRNKFKWNLNWNNSRKYMSSNGNIFHNAGHLCGEFTSHREFPSKRLVTWSFDVFFGLYLNKQLSKQSRHQWF